MEVYEEVSRKPIKTEPTRKSKILVVDDNADLLDLSRTILEGDDYEVFTAQSGQEALAILLEIENPDLILLDLLLEDMYGPDLLLKLEKRGLIENVPVVFLTAMDEVPVSRAAGFIRKPYDIDRFLVAVHDFIEAGAHRRQQNH